LFVILRKLNCCGENGYYVRRNDDDGSDVLNINFLIFIIQQNTKTIKVKNSYKSNLPYKKNYYIDIFAFL